MKEFFDLLFPVLGGIDWITDAFIFAIVPYAILSGIWFLWKTFRRRRLIVRLTKELRQFNRPAQPSIIHELKEKFNRNGEFAEAWQEFENSLITRQHDQNQSVVYKTDEASLFFSEERLLEQHLNLRYWNSVPALLVGLGILGTFFGLVWGLIPFSGIDFTQTDEIRDAIQVLLSGVSTAFITSVWGMLTSLAFSSLEKWRIGRVSRAIANLQRALDRLFTLTTQEEISFRQEDQLAQQTAALKSFSTDLANKVKRAMEPGRQEIIQALQGLPKAFSSAMAEQLVPSLDKLNETVEKLREQKEESSTDAIQKLVEEFQKFLSGSIMEQMGTLAETLGKVSESLITLPKQMEQMIAGVQKQINQTRELLNATSVEQVKQMKAMLGAVSDQTIRTLQDAIAQLQRALNSTASQTSAEFEEMTKRMRELVEQSADRLDKIFQAGEQRVSTLLQQQVEQTEAINAQLNNWQDTLTRGQEMLEQMNTGVISVGQLIETTETLSGQLMTGATQLESAGTDLTQASNAFNQENEIYLAANRETIQQLEGTLVQSRELLNDATERFKTIDAGLNNIFAEIQRGLTEYTTISRNSINNYLTGFSTQLTSAANALAGSVEALDENVDALNNMFERFRPR